MTYLIEIEVDHDSGKNPRKSIDLSNKLQEIGIDLSGLSYLLNIYTIRLTNI
nr:hypothetical protein [uncultured archaeon]